MNLMLSKRLKSLQNGQLNDLKELLNYLRRNLKVRCKPVRLLARKLRNNKISLCGNSKKELLHDVSKHWLVLIIIRLSLTWMLNHSILQAIITRLFSS